MRHLIALVLVLMTSFSQANSITAVAIEEPPFIYLNKSGEPDGPYYNMINQVLNNAGYQIPKWEILPYDVVLSSMQLKKYDFALALITLRPDSCSQFSLTDPLVDYEMVGYARKDDPVDYSVTGTINGTVKTAMMGQGHIVRTIKSIVNTESSLQLVNDSPDVVNWVLSGKADVGLTGLLTAKSYIDRGVGIRILPNYYSKDTFEFEHVQATAIVNPDNPQLLKSFNDSLRSLKESKEWESLMTEIGFSDKSIENLRTIKTTTYCKE